VGLVLSGGGARGFAHIGVLQVLQELQVPVDIVVGTSMGAVVGGAYAAGRSAAELERFAQDTDWAGVLADRPARTAGSFRRRETDLEVPSRIEFGIGPDASLIGPPAVAGSQALAQVIARHPQVERVIAGHLHRPITVRFAGTVASTCPSPAHQVALDLAPDAADNYVLEPPGYQLHWWSGQQLVSHTAYVGEYPGPYPFRMGGQLID
jgi:hypothetical protein